ncbi:tRNA adenylyltransferase [gut metagenome]|uniref:tRNA adenylyltransferase n=1 Tax=gut metagenome TaxID=749906 RepID=J9GPD4_9ZZZZ
MLKLTQKECSEILSQGVFPLITATADELGMECYVIGGYVRDLFLERPSQDIDVVVKGSGIALAEAVAAKIGRGAHLSVFKRYGTAQVKWKGLEVEFVGARKESYSPDSRKPACEDGTIEDDQNRRDFTINALAICLNKDRLGELVDPFDGLWDLEDGIIRTPMDPDVTFSDDPLRMMRCVRFATQLNFFIDEETFAALERNRERISIISGERIITELNKIMATKTPSKGFVELHRCGLLALILPELAALDLVETRNGRSHKNNFYHTLEVLDNVCRESDNLWLRWAALLHDIGKPKSKRWEPAIGWTFHNHNFIGCKMIAPLFRRMKLPMDERMKYVKKLVDLHMRPIVIADEEVTDSAVRRLLFDAGDDIDDLMLLCEADITSKNEVRKKNFLNNFKLVRSKLVDIEEKDRIRNFQPPVDGEEIMRLFNLSPCREVGSLKSALKDAILDGKVANDHDEALRFVLDRAAEMGLQPVTLAPEMAPEVAPEAPCEA